MQWRPAKDCIFLITFTLRGQRKKLARERESERECPREHEIERLGSNPVGEFGWVLNWSRKGWQTHWRRWWCCERKTKKCHHFLLPCRTLFPPSKLPNGIFFFLDKTNRLKFENVILFYIAVFFRVLLSNFIPILEIYCEYSIDF